MALLPSTRCLSPLIQLRRAAFSLSVREEAEAQGPCRAVRVNFTIAALNFLYLGLPKGRLQLAFPSELSEAQASAHARLIRETEEFCRSSGGDISSCGRGRQRLQELVSSVSPAAYGRLPIV